jgi:hypothetical protein
MQDRSTWCPIRQGDLVEFGQAQDIANGAMAFDWMAKGCVRVDPIDVTASGSVSPKHASFLKIAQDLCDRSLGYSNSIG